MNNHNEDIPRAVILASASSSRARLLAAAGIVFDVVPAGVDEGEVKAALLSEGAEPFTIAEALAELKALQVSQRRPGRLVIGADQILECNGILFDKPADVDHAKAHLRALRGNAHMLLTSVCVVRDNAVLWHHNERATLTMRQFDDGFIDDYVEAAGPQICQSVGAYQVEGRGVQLFRKIEGDFYTIQGLPLLPLLDFLRNQGVVPQ